MKWLIRYASLLTIVCTVWIELERNLPLYRQGMWYALLVAMLPPALMVLFLVFVKINVRNKPGLSRVQNELRPEVAKLAILAAGMLFLKYAPH